jgi:hypothetical protein
VAWLANAVDRNVIPAVHEFQVANRVVAALMVLVMDVAAFGNWSVMKFPHCAMKSAALALKVKAASVIALTPELLHGIAVHNWVAPKSFA